MKKPEQTYILLSLTRHWNDNPADRDIPLIGLSPEAQSAVLDRAQLWQTQDEPRRLRQLLTIPPVGECQ